MAIAPGGLRTDRVAAAALEAQQHARPAGPDDEVLEVASCGRPLPGHEVSLVDETGAACPARRVGEIWTRGPSVAGGYVADGEGTAESAATFRHDGWLRTGDRGCLTGDGHLHVVGRRKDVLVVNGHNIDPQRVEWLAETVEWVRPNGAVAFTRPGPETEEIVVVVECRPGREAGVADAVRRAVAGRLSVPVSEVVLGRPGAVLRTTSGKPRRRQMRTDYLERRTAAAPHR